MLERKNKIGFKAKFWDFSFSHILLVCRILMHINPYQATEYWWHQNICDWFCAKYYGVPVTNFTTWKKRPHFWTCLIDILWEEKI